MSFADILRKGKKQFKVKDQKGHWGRCEYCDKRQLLFPYRDDKNEPWYVCENCSDLFVKEGV